jgi:hypothetical protein
MMLSARQIGELWIHGLYVVILAESCDQFWCFLFIEFKWLIFLFLSCPWSLHFPFTSHLLRCHSLIIIRWFLLHYFYGYSYFSLCSE